MFNLTTEIAVWRKSILETETCTESDVNELESHLNEDMEQLKTKDLSEQEAFIVAVTRIGKPAEITGEFAKINKRKISCNHILRICLAAVALIYLLRTLSIPIPGFRAEVYGGNKLDSYLNLWPAYLKLTLDVMAIALLAFLSVAPNIVFKTKNHGRTSHV